MDLLDEVRRALKPMMDSGIVLQVRQDHAEHSRGGLKPAPGAVAWVGDNDPNEHVGESTG